MTTEIIKEPVITDTSSTETETPKVIEMTGDITPTVPTTETKTEVITKTPEIKTEIKEEVKEETKTEKQLNDWKKEIAGDDEKLFKKIDKYNSPKDVALALIEAQQLISSTRALPKLGDNATPEEIAQYRDIAGIPNEAKDYDIGENIPEEYKGVIDKYLEVAHENNRHPTTVKQNIADYLKIEDAARQALVTQITKAQEETQAQLKQNWGDHYEVNKTAVDNFLTKTFGEESEKVLEAYLPDGTKLRHNASVYSKLLDISKHNLGIDTIIPNNLTQNVVDLGARLKTLNEMASNSKSAYWGANHNQFKAERDQLSTQIENIKKNRL